MSAFLAGLFATLGVLTAIVAVAACLLIGLFIVAFVAGMVSYWQPRRAKAFEEFSRPIQKWITLEEGGFDERAILRDLRGPYILAPINSKGTQARFRMRQRVERIDYHDIAQMRDVTYFRKATK